MLLGLFSGLSEVGGIQRISQHVGAVLAEMARSRAEPCELFGLNDPPGVHSFVLEGREYSFRGFGRNKPKFIASALSLSRRVRLAYFGHPNVAPLGLLLRLRNSRLQYWVASYGVEVWSPLSPMRRVALRNARGITALSWFTAGQIARAQRVPPSKVALLLPALDPSFTNACTNGGVVSLPDHTRVILTVGRLLMSEPGKGVDTLIRALPKILSKVPNAILAVVGDGDQLPYLQRLAEELNVSEQVLFAGEKKTDELRTYYARADLFAMPSRQEGFGVVFLEAMAFGKPVIGGNHGGTPEVVIDGVNGFLVQYGDVDALADRVLLLLKDENLRKRMGAAGLREVKEHYTFERFRSRLTQLLTEADARN